jgi:hypothetical protein
MARISSMTQRQQGLHITTDTFNGIEEYIRWAQNVPREFPRAMNLLIRFMAYTDQGFSQRYSAGVYDPSGERKQFAWRVPVRRITEKYFLGWKTKRITQGVWEVYNDSRAAFYVEYGIHVSGDRVRRPVRKMALRKTMEAMMRTHAYHRCWCEIYANPRRGKRHVGKGFTQHVQSPGMGGFSGPMLGRRLPG